MTGHKTLKERGYAINEVKNSKFIAYASPVLDENEAKMFIRSIKTKHNDANHNVSAYLINSNGVFTVKYDDDGEPAGSSGKPVLKVLEMKGLSNVAVVVTRYFGGIKLGFGGLARAYRGTASQAIENTKIIELFDRTLLIIESGYSDMNTVTRLVEDYGIVVETEYSEVVNMTIEIDSEAESEFREKVINLTSNRVTVK